MDYDAAWTRLFDQPIMVQHLIRLAVPELGGRLGFETLEAVPTRWALARTPEDGLLRTAGAYAPRTGDRAWRVWYGDGSGRSLIVLVEFQSEPDAHMDLRSMEYAQLAYQSEQRRRRDADGGLRVLPVVVFAGHGRWAATDPPWAVRAAAVAADGEVGLPLRACAVLLDAQSRRREDSGGANIVALLLRLNASAPEDAHGTLEQMARWLRREPSSELARVLVDELADWMSVCLNLSREAAASIRRMLAGDKETEGMMALAKRAQELREEGKVQGRIEGSAEGQAQLLVSLAERRFGEATAAALAVRLEHVRDADAFVDIGAWVADCHTGREVLERINGLAPELR